MKTHHFKIITILTIILSIVLAVVSFYGIFIPGTYIRETASMAAQGIGQDIFDLFFVVPMLLISLYFVSKEKRSALFIFSGTVLYIIYSFFIYSFGLHFNNLFLLYCTILGLSLYTFILIISQLVKMDVHDWFNNKIPLKSIAVFFLITALMFYAVWLKDIIPAIVNNTVPKSVSDYNLLVNPVHVLDIGIFLPGFIITAILLLRKKQIGFVLTPILLLFIILMALALFSMVILLHIRGISEDLSISGIFIILVIVSGFFLLGLMHEIESSK